MAQAIVAPALMVSMPSSSQRLAARQMISQGDGGRIINITSVHQERAWGWDSVYGPMKAALRRLTMSQRATAGRMTTGPQTQR